MNEKDPGYQRLIARIKERVKNRKKKPHGNIKCDCGHPQKDHYAGEGWCHSSTHSNPGACGCTWFYPNANYIKRKNAEAGASEVQGRIINSGQAQGTVE